MHSNQLPTPITTRWLERERTPRLVSNNRMERPTYPQRLHRLSQRSIGFPRSQRNQVRWGKEARFSTPRWLYSPLPTWQSPKVFQRLQNSRYLRKRRIGLLRKPSRTYHKLQRRRGVYSQQPSRRDWMRKHCSQNYKGWILISLLLLTPLLETLPNKEEIPLEIEVKALKVPRASKQKSRSSKTMKTSSDMQTLPANPMENVSIGFHVGQTPGELWNKVQDYHNQQAEQYIRDSGLDPQEMQESIRKQGLKLNLKKMGLGKTSKEQEEEMDHLKYLVWMKKQEDSARRQMGSKQKKQKKEKTSPTQPTNPKKANNKKGTQAKQSEMQLPVSE